MALDSTLLDSNTDAAAEIKNSPDKDQGRHKLYGSVGVFGRQIERYIYYM